jgi:hypothetical protein
MEDLKMAMEKSWQEMQAEQRAEGRAEGQAEGQAQSLLTLLELRGVTVPADDRERVLAEKSMSRLGDWFRRAAFATSLSEVLGSSP